MSLRAEQERLSALMADVNKWNSLTEEERGRWLHQDPWATFNNIATLLTPEQIKALQTHQSFQSLRQEFDRCIYVDKSSLDSVRRLTDKFVEAVQAL